MNNTNQGGFTLYELMVTVAIVGVVLAFGVPNMRQFSQNSKMTSTANDLHAAFHLARSESSRAKTNITLCASANSMTADADCGGTWDQGYIVFVDTDGDIARAGDTETVIRAQPAIADGVVLKVANDARYFSFAATGLGRANVNDLPALSQVIMCDERGNITAAGGNSAARLFVATPLGRATIQRDKSMIEEVLEEWDESCP
ncbi:MAG: GspH/FimT family pseudopilin [Gammaproteobacteria bacterium]|nr:GspH/FimT family pseudopilin [Gammaproteobacteria bacterium]MBT8110140.1 GspH/FimT family pseudopilin [Gammaproteobacteria bacterium]NND47706.1 prepilin-type N-terminal cleavage/methylation domain-containing protein [Woeseiaceae bacterium]NNL44844.1 prepilin-type N-terminal cleavage/methylation domain-containing protein [Woeseiaceae bacterium]